MTGLAEEFSSFDHGQSFSLSAYGKARATVQGAPLGEDELKRTHAYWRACNYLRLGMIYLRDNPLLREPLPPEHLKARLLGHWGSSPGQAFIWVHLNRLIEKNDLDMIYLSGPGHGAPGVLAPVYLEGSYSSVYPDRREDEQGLAILDQAGGGLVILGLILGDKAIERRLGLGPAGRFIDRMEIGLGLALH